MSLSVKPANESLLNHQACRGAIPPAAEALLEYVDCRSYSVGVTVTFYFLISLYPAFQMFRSY